MPTPFPPGWWSFDLGKYRPCDGTYELYPYESIPPIDTSLFVGQLQWLPPIDDDLDDLLDDLLDDDDDDDDDDLTEDDDDLTEDDDDEPYVEQADRLVNLAAALGKVGLALPPVFVKFLGDDDLKDAVPSCTACEWDLSEAPVASSAHAGAWFVRFLRDQQDCLFWYLYLTPDGGSCVVCSPIPYDDLTEMEPADVVRENTHWVAPDFESFLYRFWMENVLWELLDESKKPALDAAQAAYLAHYKPSKPSKPARPAKPG